jgi:hypothetical protein
MSSSFYYYKERLGRRYKIYKKLWPKAYSDKRTSLYLVIHPDEVFDKGTGYLWEIKYSESSGYLIDEPDLNKTRNLIRRSKKDVMLYDGELTKAIEELGFTVLPEHANDEKFITFEDNIKKQEPKFIEVVKPKWKAKWVIPK